MKYIKNKRVCKRVKILGCPIDVLTMEDTLLLMEQTIREKRSMLHSVVNAGKLVCMRKDADLFNAVIAADIINADGMPIVWLSRLFGCRLPERVAGIDLMQRIIEKAGNENWKIFLLGAKQEIVERAARYSQERTGKDIVAGFRNGYFKREEEREIARRVNESGAQILFVGMSSPLKELFLCRQRHILKNINILMGVGGSFDVIAGKVKRAPPWMRNRGLEWFFRILQEPGRMLRKYIYTNTLFLVYVFRELIHRCIRRM